jgi:hypothetical protein
MIKTSVAKLELVYKRLKNYLAIVAKSISTAKKNNNL